MADKRESILDAIISNNIANILTANGYHNNLSSVQYTSAYRDRKDVVPSNFPFICLLPGPAPYYPLTNTQYTSGDSQIQLDGWLITVIGYVAKNTDEQLKSDQENLVTDIIKAIESDPQLGLSYVVNTTLKMVDVYPDILLENIGIVNVMFAVKYDFERSAP